MSQTTIPNDLHVQGALSCQTFSPPASSITNAAIVANAAIAATKVVHRRGLDYCQLASGAIAAETRELHIVYGATGTLIAFKAAITGTIATGADRTVTVDLHKSTGAAAFATVLSATIGFTNASVLRTVVSGTINSTSLVAGDILRIVVTVAGSAGNQALGLVATLTLDEDPQ